MFITILSKEIRRHLMTFHFGASLLTIFLLVTVSAWILSDDYIRRRNTYNVTAERSRDADRQVYVRSQISPILHRPPAPLSIFAQGEDRRLGNSVQVRRWTVPREATGSFTDNEFMASLPNFDLLTIIAVVVSLFGILFAYDGISGEREAGTLKLMFTGGLRRGTLFAAKFVAGIVCLALPILLAFLCSVLMLSFVFNLTFTGSQWLAITVMPAAGLVYGALFVSVGLLSSVLVRRSSTALILSLLLWALGVLVVPGVAQSAAALLVEAPESEEIFKMERELRRDRDREQDKFIQENEGSFSGWHGGWSGENYQLYEGNEINVRFMSNYVSFSEPRAMDRAEDIWRIYRRHEDIWLRQAVLADSMAFVAPVQHLRRTFTLLSGTDITAYRNFLEAVRRYRSAMLSEFKSRGYFGDNSLEFFTRLHKSELGEESRRRRQEEYDRIIAKVGMQDYVNNFWDLYYGPLPESEITPFSISSGEPDFEGAIQPVSVLLLSVLIVFSLGFVVFTRYDVR